MEEYTEHLFSLRDEKYRDFTSRLLPNIDKKFIIGVRIPLIRKYAKELYKSGEYPRFINTLPHTYYEENQLHSCIVSLIKDFDEAMRRTEEFLPYIDTWAVCDGFNPKCFKNNKDKLYEKIKEWIKSDGVYIKRFAIDMLMGYYLDDSFSTEHLSLVASAQGEDYYLKMAVAWYFATALAKQYDEAVVILENKSLDKWTHNMTIRKASESYRISDERKAYLKSLRIK